MNVLVVGEGAGPIRDVRATLRSWDRELETRQTDPEGRCRFERRGGIGGLLFASHPDWGLSRVHFYPPQDAGDWSRWPLSWIRGLEAGEERQVVLTLPRRNLARIQGIVVDEFGVPIAGARVALREDGAVYIFYPPEDRMDNW